jgi:hypothetical protein
MGASSWGADACDACRTSALRGGGEPPLVRLDDGPGLISLHRCQRCGALWEANVREAHVISEEVARRDFPDVHISPPPTRRA